MLKHRSRAACKDADSVAAPCTQGVIPDCLTRTESLLHLYLSDNALRGPLPDFSPTTSLQLLFARDQAVDGAPSLTGPLPASLASAPHLAYLQLSNVGLTGSIGTLPPLMRCVLLYSNSQQCCAAPCVPCMLAGTCRCF